MLCPTHKISDTLSWMSTVTDAVVAEVTAWQSRPLEPMYPVVFFDALRVKIRDEATVRSRAVYLALAVLPDGSGLLACLMHHSRLALRRQARRPNRKEVIQCLIVYRRGRRHP